MSTLGALLKRQRERHGWTQQQVIDRTGLDRSSSYLSSIETGKTSPSIDELDALARLFGATAIDLLREASGIPADWEFEPNSDLERLVTLYQTLDPVEKDSALAYLEFLIERQQRKTVPQNRSPHAARPVGRLGAAKI